MFNTIRGKLTLSYLVVALLTALLCYGMLAFSVNSRLRNLVADQNAAEIEADIVAWYAAMQTWEGFDAYYQALHPPQHDNVQGLPGRRPPPPSLHGITDANYRALTPYYSYAPGDILPAEIMQKAAPLLWEGQTIAYLIPRDTAGVSLSRSEQRFIRDTNQGFLVAGLIALLAALVAGWRLAQQFVKPVEALTAAAAAIKTDAFPQYVDVVSNDELGELAATFNAMTDQLTASKQQRLQMTADIAHDLATPLQVVAGYIEAIRDGQLTLTPARLETISTEIGHLQRLVNDLDLLSQADMDKLQLELTTVNLVDFLRHIVESFTPLAASADVTLTAEVPSILPTIVADDERLLQVLGNLLRNAVQYTPANGTVTIAAQAVANGVQICVKDTGVGIAPADQPHIFDRFYRADEARTDSSNMGLGLAISKGLVEAMQGSIAVGANNPQGTVFTLWFPTA